MQKAKIIPNAGTLMLSLILFGQFAAAQRTPSAGNMHWVASWASAQQQPRGPLGGRGPAPAATSPSPAVPTPAVAPPAAQASPAAAAPRVAPPPGGFNNQTVRMIVRASIGGSRVRVHLSNAFGATPLVVGAAHVAVRGKDSAIVAGSDRALTFSGKRSVTVPPGAEMLSDPVDLEVPKLADLAVSVYAPGETGPASAHSLGLHTTYVSKEGDFTSTPEFTDATTTQAWYWVSAVDVLAPADAATIVAFGDSITDGATSTPNTDRSWPSVLAQRLQANPSTANIGIVNEGISGNRILGDGAGVSALARFDHDVLALAGVKWVMILEGINDMNLAGRGGTTAGPTLTADDLIGAMNQMIERAHTHGIKVVGCTLTPFGGASDNVEAMRQALNAFIRTGPFDAVVDFDKVILDPNNPRQFRQGYNNTDRLHPNDAGYKAMADAVDLSIFAPKPASPTGR